MAQKPLEGVVLDAETGEPMPFVSVIYNPPRKLGVATDVDGFFSIVDPQNVSRLDVSFIGYKRVVITLDSLRKMPRPLVIRMTPDFATLGEVEVIAGENPALRIIRNASKNRLFNNPNNLESYRYRSYNKNVITYRLNPDSSLTLTARDSAGLKRDSVRAERRHLLVMESVTKKAFKQPKMHHETVIGTKISGFKDPIVGMVPADVQHFGFYDDIMPLLNKDFISPLARGALDNYQYIILDSTFHRGDTTYIIQFKPEKKTKFEACEGVMHITTDGWALTYVNVDPADKGKINLNMEQFYRKVDGEHWFPVQLNFTVDLDRVPLRKTGGVMIGKTFIDSIQINVPVDNSEFKTETVSILKTAGKVDQSFWDSHRSETLSLKEETTIEEMDALGDKYKFDFLMKGFRNFYQGNLSAGPLDFRVSKFLRYNNIEGFRLGAGIYTNQEVSEHFLVGGYAGYGTKDFEWKYGLTFRVFNDFNKDYDLTINLIHDLQDPAGMRLQYYDRPSFSDQFFNNYMDRWDEVNVSGGFRLGKYFKMRAGVRQYRLQPLYDYTFVPAPAVSDGTQTFNLSEFQIQARWAFRERLQANYGQRISLGTKWPVVMASYSRGTKGFLDGEFDYHRIEAGILWERNIKFLGYLTLQLEGGFVDNPVPYSLMFSPRPSFNPSFSVIVRNTFQTMRFNEFASNRYAALYIRHNFGPLLIRSEWFKPEFRFYQGIAIGAFDNPELHQGIPLKSLEEGYFESGIDFANLLRFNILNVGYLGFGVGVFYRYGPYALENNRDNWAFKLSVMYSVN